MLKTRKNTFKLYYFKSNSRAQVIRALLSWSKVDWEDIHLSKEQFEELKLKFNSNSCKPIKNSNTYSDKIQSINNFNLCFNKLPILEYKGNFFCQSHAIEYYLAKKFKLIDSDYENEYIILNLLSSYEEIHSRLISIIIPDNLYDKDNLEINAKEFLEITLPNYLSQYESIIKRNNTDIEFEYSKIKERNIELKFSEDKSSNVYYFFKEKISLADFIFGIFYYYVLYNPIRYNSLKHIIEKYSPCLGFYIEKLFYSGEFSDFYNNCYIKDSKY